MILHSIHIKYLVYIIRKTLSEPYYGTRKYLSYIKINTYYKNTRVIRNRKVFIIFCST